MITRSSRWWLILLWVNLLGSLYGFWWYLGPAVGRPGSGRAEGGARLAGWLDRTLRPRFGHHPQPRLGRIPDRTVYRLLVPAQLRLKEQWRT